MQKNLKLKIALMQKNLTQRDLAKATRIPEASLSLAIRGRLILSDQQWQRIASTLDMPVSDLK